MLIFKKVLFNMFNLTLHLFCVALKKVYIYSVFNLQTMVTKAAFVLAHDCSLNYMKYDYSANAFLAKSQSYQSCFRAGLKIDKHTNGLSQRIKTLFYVTRKTNVLESNEWWVTPQITVELLIILSAGSIWRGEADFHPFVMRQGGL